MTITVRKKYTKWKARQKGAVKNNLQPQKRIYGAPCFQEVLNKFMTTHPNASKHDTDKYQRLYHSIIYANKCCEHYFMLPGFIEWLKLITCITRTKIHLTPVLYRQEAVQQAIDDILLLYNPNGVIHDTGIANYPKAVTAIKEQLNNFLTAHYLPNSNQDNSKLICHIVSLAADPQVNYLLRFKPLLFVNSIKFH